MKVSFFLGACDGVIALCVLVIDKEVETFFASGGENISQRSTLSELWGVEKDKWANCAASLYFNNNFGRDSLKVVSNSLDE